MTEDRKLWVPPSVGRRRLLLGAGAAAVLAACGSSGGETGAPATNGTTAPTDPPSDTTGSTDPAGTAAPDTAAPATDPPAGGPQKGGTLRVGVVGSTNDIMDGQYIVSRADQVRLVSSWEGIANYDDDFNLDFAHSLGEEIEVVAPDKYVVRLKEGIEFHNGKTVGADDLIYSFQRLLDPELGLAP
ncbi:MAG: ABC-type transport system substrate-binding protein, partial [Ilumatobacter sp.]